MDQGYGYDQLMRPLRSSLGLSGSFRVGGLGRGSNPLKSFFPFDPLLLRRSHDYIEEFYKHWQGPCQEEDVLVIDDSSEPGEDSDFEMEQHMDASDDEDDVEEDNVVEDDAEEEDVEEDDDEDDEEFSEEEQNMTSAKIPKKSTKSPRQARESPDSIVIEQDDEDLVDFPIDYESEIEIEYQKPKNSSNEKTNLIEYLFTNLIITFMIKIFF